MHSRIFQITTNPVPKENYITTSDFEDHWFTDSIADYVSDDNDRAEDIKWLRSFLEHKKTVAFDESDSSFEILSHGREAYFAHAYADFTAARGETMGLGLPEFASCGEVTDFSMLLWRMNNAFCSKYDFYVTLDEVGTIPLDKFIRQAETGTRYYIGGVLDYHF